MMSFAIFSATMIAFNLVSTFAHNLDGRKFDDHDREHLQSHVQGELDLSAMSTEELRFVYFQSHDSESNNKMDGCELVQSLLHFQAEESAFHGESSKVFSDAELSMMVDPLMAIADKNMDGFIDYPEFVSGQSFKGY